MKKLLLITISLLGVNTSVNAQVIASGSYSNSSYFLCNTSGSPKACGDNGSGQLGDGTTSDRPAPVVSGLSGINAIAGGAVHSLFLKNDSSVSAYGYNFYGQLGDGTTSNSTTPVQVNGLSGITAIAAGHSHSLFLKSDGSVWACGSNNDGALGDGTGTDRHSPIQVSGLSGITAIAAGYNYSLFLKNDGSVWACGKNNNGQLGDGTTTWRPTPVQVSGLSGITAIAAGQFHSLFLKNNGRVWACGNNFYGQLGDGTNTGRTTPVQAGGPPGIAAIAAGGSHSLFLKNDSYVWACGYNNKGQLGDGTTTNRLSPVQVLWSYGTTAIAGGYSHSLFLKNDISAWSCGFNTDGQLGDGTGIDRHTMVQVTSSATITSANSASICSGVNLNISLTSNISSIGYTWVADDNVTTTGESASVQSTSVINDVIVNNTGVSQLVSYTVTPYDCFATGLEQAVIITVEPSPILTLTTNGNILTADASNATYQWLDCDNSNLPIGSETGQIFTATQSGNYSVIVTENACVDTSQCENVITVGVNNHFSKAELSVYPNPTNGRVHIDLISVTGLLKTEIFNSLGELVRSDIRKSVKSFDLQLPDTDGIYFIRLFDADGHVLSAKVLKE